VVCPSESAISGWEIRETRGDKQVVEYVAPECRTLKPPHDVVRVGRLSFGRRAAPYSGDGAFSPGPVWHGCPQGELAIGMQGASGAYVDRLGLVCAPAPGKRIVRFGRP
jgi:hypothetical protein